VARIAGARKAANHPGDSSRSQTMSENVYEQRPGTDEYLAYYGKYVERVPAGDIVAILESQPGATHALLEHLSEKQAEYAYAPGKWTIKEVVCHLADTERIFTYRLLRFARGDATPLEGYEENVYVPAAQANTRTLPSLLEELRAVRASSIALLRGIPQEAWTRAGIASNARISVRAIATIMAGHELHHRSLLVERYGLGG
jgi:uncharacterized damage-inducible protein DinB